MAAGHRVVSIGGSTCVGSIGELVTSSSVFEARDVWDAIELAHDDTSLAVLGFPQPGMLLPKLVLVYTVMQQAQLHGDNMLRRQAHWGCLRHRQPSSKKTRRLNRIEISFTFFPGMEHWVKSSSEI